MSEARRRRLEALPGWVWNKFAQFQEGLRFLRAFSEREGHARVPALHVEEGFHLGRWVPPPGAKRRDEPGADEGARGDPRLELAPAAAQSLTGRASARRSSYAVRSVRSSASVGVRSEGERHGEERGSGGLGRRVGLRDRMGIRRRTVCQDVGHVDQRGLRGRGVDRKERVGADRDEEVVVGIERDAEARCFEASRPDRDG